MNTATLRAQILLCMFGYLFLFDSFSQQVYFLQDTYKTDNSYYDIAKVGPNEFWAAGENGTLFRLDSTGNLTEMPFPYKKTNILKIVASDEAVFLAADGGNLFKYDRQTQAFTRASFGNRFRKLCFYDLVMLDDGNLLVAGGNSKIAKAEKALPMGFLAKISPDLINPPEVVWKNPFTFVWSITQVPESGEILAASFNGVNTHILSSLDKGNSFQKRDRIRGLVHHLLWWDGEIWFSGAKNMSYRKTGIIGRLGKADRQLLKEGCVWSLVPFDGRLLGLNNSGSVLLPDVKGNYVDHLALGKYSLYEGLAISPSRTLLVGHGRQLIVVDRKTEKFTYTFSADPSQEVE